MGVVGADFIRSQLFTPGPTFTMTYVIQPSLTPPYRHWREAGDVIHWTGTNIRETSVAGAVEARQEVRMRVCDFTEVQNDFGPGNGLVTCVRCLTYEHERIRR